jgi:hypothetical protein
MTTLREVDGVLLYIGVRVCNACRDTQWYFPTTVYLVKTNSEGNIQ